MPSFFLLNTLKKYIKIWKTSVNVVKYWYEKENTNCFNINGILFI